MKTHHIKIFLSLILLCSSFAGTLHAIFWQYDLEVALKKAGSEGKPVLVDFYTDWCGWCKKMDADTYGDRAVNNSASGFVCVKVNGDKRRDLVRKYNIKAYPTTLFLNDKGVVVEKIRGYIGPDRFVTIMKSVMKRQPPPAKKKKKVKRSRFKLTGIIYSSEAPKAIVNNTIVSVEDIVDGAKVVKITRNKVILFYQNKETVLTLE
ncbi:MAG: thioredoxin family protein [Candidatus Omnitrophota bacterium]